MRRLILHIAERAVWERARDGSSYVPEEFQEDGFVHCSYAEQVVGVANALFPGRTDLVLLVIDVDRLSSPVRREPPFPGARPDAPLFPHVYGPVDVAAVVDVIPFAPRAEGGFELPEQLRGRDEPTLREIWDRQADEWLRFVRTPGHDVSHERVNGPPFLELLPPPGRLTLDLGCGEGRLVRTLTERGHRILGVDISPAMIRAAAGADPSGWYAVADAARLPLADASVDLVVAYMSLHDVDDYEGAIGEATRVLGAGGHLCVAVLHPIAMAGRWEEPTGDASFVIEESYTQTRRYRYLSDRGGIRIEFGATHRSLETLLAPMEHAGLMIERLREIRAPEDLVVEFPAKRRWQRVPLFLQLRAVKVAERESGTAPVR